MTKQGKKRKEPSSDEKTDCKFFLQNSCKFGDRCRNIHDRKKLKTGGDGKPSIKILDPSVPGVESTTTGEICKWLTKGACKFGARCRNFHPPGSIIPRPASIYQFAPFSVGDTQSTDPTKSGESQTGQPGQPAGPAPAGKRERENTLCKFYLRGDCKFGDRCRSIHPDTSGGIGPSTLGLGALGTTGVPAGFSLTGLGAGFVPGFGGSAAFGGTYGIPGFSTLPQQGVPPVSFVDPRLVSYLRKGQTLKPEGNLNWA